MRHATIAHRIVPAFIALSAASATTAIAQTKQAGQAQSPAPMTRAEIESFAKVEVTIGAARDTVQAKLAQTRNKKDETQAALRDSLSTQIAGILKQSGLSESDYRKKLFYVSTNGDARKVFDSTFAKLTGQPLPGQLAAAPAALKVPSGEVGVHIGHIINAFDAAPDKMSLVAIANMEARTAAQHAALGARNPNDLAALKLHAGHVLNALDPSLQPMGPGKGFGLKKAAAGITQHIELAAKVTGASQNVIVHANHIGTSAKNTSARVEQAIALCQKIQAAPDAAAASSLMTQLVSLTAQLVPGADANNDGRIGWQENEGGLQQVEDHVKLLLAGEGLGG